MNLIQRKINQTSDPNFKLFFYMRAEKKFNLIVFCGVPGTKKNKRKETILREAQRYIVSI